MLSISLNHNVSSSHPSSYPKTVRLNCSSYNPISNRTSPTEAKQQALTPGSFSNMTFSILLSRTFSTVKPASFARSKNARSFSSNQGRYGVKKTKALESLLFFISCSTLETSLRCSEWLNKTSARMRMSKPVTPGCRHDVSFCGDAPHR